MTPHGSSDQGKSWEMGEGKKRIRIQIFLVLCKTKHQFSLISTTSMAWWIITKIQKMRWGGKWAHGPEVTHDCVRCGERKLDWCHVWQEEWLCCTCNKQIWGGDWWRLGRKGRLPVLQHSAQAVGWCEWLGSAVACPQPPGRGNSRTRHNKGQHKISEVQGPLSKYATLGLAPQFLPCPQHWSKTSVSTLNQGVP